MSKPQCAFVPADLFWPQGVPPLPPLSSLIRELRECIATFRSGLLPKVRYYDEPSNLKSEHQSDSVDHGLHCSSYIKNQFKDTEGCRHDVAARMALDEYETNAPVFSNELGKMFRSQRRPCVIRKVGDWWIIENVNNAFSNQFVLSSRHQTSIVDASCEWRKLNQRMKPNCECSHHSPKNHTVQFSNILLDENLEPRIYDTDVSMPYDQTHTCDPQFVIQMNRSWIFDSGASFSSARNLAAFDGLHDCHPAAVSVAKGQIIKRNSSIRCPLVKMLLFGKEIKVPVSWRFLNQKTRYMKRNGTYHRCSSLLILTEAPIEKETVSSGNGKGADNGSSEEVSSYQANHSLNFPAETPMSQSESSISRPDETAIVDNSSTTRSRTFESTWHIVSAAAHHMTGVQDLLTHYTHMSGELDVHTPTMGHMKVIGSGSVNTVNIKLQDVWYVPGLDSNLVSTSQLTKLGHTVSLCPDGCRIRKDSEDGVVIGLAHFTDDNLCVVDSLDDQSTN